MAWVDNYDYMLEQECDYVDTLRKEEREEYLKMLEERKEDYYDADDEF